MAEFGEEACGPDSHPSKSLLPLAIASPESENPFRLWEKPHKKRKAQPKSTLVSIYNWGGRNFTQIQLTYEKKNQLLRGRCVSHFLSALIF